MNPTPNKIPLPRTIARHYKDGKYCDYPADTVFSAVNSHELPYNPTAIPFKIGFARLFICDFNAFVYLCSHNSEAEIQEFLERPDEFMAEAGISLSYPLDKAAAGIFAAIAEDDMQRALKSDNSLEVLFAIHSTNGHTWGNRHPERYPKGFMTRGCPTGLTLPKRIDNEESKKLGVSDTTLSVSLLHIIDFFSEK